MTSGSTRVGVRELRQNLSVYLARIARGEVFEVTDRGNAVALLTPLPAVASRLGNLLATGRARPARADLQRLAPPKAAAPRPASQALTNARRRTAP